MLEFLHRWFIGSSRVREITAQVRKPQFRPQLEILDDRFAPAVFNVNSVVDILNPPASVVTLPPAFEAPNATPNDNTINLTVPGTNSISLPGTPGEVDNSATEFALSAASGNLTIQNTNGSPVSVNGNPLTRVFGINSNVTTGSVILTTGGQGFTPPPTAPIANGQVTGMTSTNPGSDLTSAPPVPFTAGGGQGAAATAILASPKSAVTLSNFTIENGNASGGDVPAGAGGGIHDNANASLTLTNMVMTNNSATADGVAVSMAGLFDTPWALTLNTTTVSDNHASNQGSGLEEDGTQDKRTKFKPISIYS